MVKEIWSHFFISRLSWAVSKVHNTLLQLQRSSKCFSSPHFSSSFWQKARQLYFRALKAGSFGRVSLQAPDGKVLSCNGKELMGVQLHLLLIQSLSSHLYCQRLHVRGENCTPFLSWVLPLILAARLPIQCGIEACWMSFVMKSQQISVCCAQTMWLVQPTSGLHWIWRVGKRYMDGQGQMEHLFSITCRREVICLMSMPLAWSIHRQASAKALGPTSIMQAATINGSLHFQRGTRKCWMDETWPAWSAD